MKKLLLATTAIIALSTASAFAALSNQDIIALYPDATHIEVERSETETRIEVFIGNRKIEVVFANDDANTQLSYEERELTQEEIEDLADEDEFFEDDSDDEDEDDDDEEDEDEDDDEDDEDEDEEEDDDDGDED